MYGFFNWDEEMGATAPGKLFRWRVRFFDTVDWNWVDETLLAYTEADCKAWADAECKPELRQRNYPEGVKDSLQIIKLSEVTLPLVV